MSLSRPDGGAAALDQLMTVALRLSSMLDVGLAEHGLTHARAGVIWQLHQHGPVMQRELSQALSVSPRNVTGLIDPLQAAGFVARRPHPDDRRAALVSLTEQGEAAAEAMQHGRETFAELLFGSLSPAELTRLTDTLDQILTVLESTDADALTLGPEAR